MAMRDSEDECTPEFARSVIFTTSDGEVVVGNEFVKLCIIL